MRRRLFEGRLRPMIASDPSLKRFPEPLRHNATR
jgi:hypothetical protein